MWLFCLLRTFVDGLFGHPGEETLSGSGFSHWRRGQLQYSTLCVSYLVSLHTEGACASACWLSPMANSAPQA